MHERFEAHRASLLRLDASMLDRLGFRYFLRRLPDSVIRMRVRSPIPVIEPVCHYPPRAYRPTLSRTRNARPHGVVPPLEGVVHALEDRAVVARDRQVDIGAAHLHDAQGFELVTGPAC